MHRRILPRDKFAIINGGTDFHNRDIIVGHFVGIGHCSVKVWKKKCIYTFEEKAQAMVDIWIDIGCIIQLRKVLDCGNFLMSQNVKVLMQCHIFQMENSSCNIIT